MRQRRADARDRGERARDAGVMCHDENGRRGWPVRINRCLRDNRADRRVIVTTRFGRALVQRTLRRTLEPAVERAHVVHHRDDGERDGEGQEQRLHVFEMSTPGASL